MRTTKRARARADATKRRAERSNASEAAQRGVVLVDVTPEVRDAAVVAMVVRQLAQSQPLAKRHGDTLTERVLEAVAERCLVFEFGSSVEVRAEFDRRRGEFVVTVQPWAGRRLTLQAAKEFADAVMEAAAFARSVNATLQPVNEAAMRASRLVWEADPETIARVCQLAGLEPLPADSAPVAAPNPGASNPR